MKKILVLLLHTVIFSAFCSHDAQAVRVQGIEIIEYGVYEAVTERKKSHLTAIVPTHILKDLKCIKKTSAIRAKLGTRFGFRFRIKGTPKNEAILVRHKIEYPGLKDPMTGRIVYSDEVNREVVIGQPNYVGHTFEMNGQLYQEPGSFNCFSEARN